MENTENRKTLAIVLGRGGHTIQMLKLVGMLGEKYNYEYIVGKNDKLSIERMKIPGKVFLVSNPRTMEDKNWFRVIFKLFSTTLQSLNILMKAKSKVIITCGPGLGTTFAYLGKILFRKKLIFIESWSRVYSKSITGKSLYKIADLSFIQWPQQRENYPNAIYAGRFG